MNDKVELEHLEDHAYKGVVRLAGSILVLSVAFKVIGLDFTPVMQAMTASIARSVETQDNSEIMAKLEQIENRLIIVEKLAHEEKTK